MRLTKKTYKKIDFEKIKFFIFIIFSVISLLIIFLAGSLEYDVDKIQSFVSNYEQTSFIVYILLMALATMTTFPLSAILIVGIFMFSIFYTILLAIIGMFIGSILMYYFSKKMGKGFIRRYGDLKGGKLQAFNNLLDEKSFGVVMIFNMVYFLPSNLGSMVAGITNIKLWKFSLANILGNLPNTLGVVFLVAGLQNSDKDYLVFAMSVLILSTVISIYSYRSHLKDIFILAFGKESWKSFRKLQREYS